MGIANLITLSLMSAVLCAGVTEASLAQGGWRQWEVRLRDGRRLEANPLGAPDDTHLSLNVGAYDGRGGRIARSLVDVVAALPVPDSLSAAPVASCEDAIVRRDGATTVGRITLAHIRWSEGVVVQRGDTVDLRDVAYLVFAARDSASANEAGSGRRETGDGKKSGCSRVSRGIPSELTFYPIGGGQIPLCNGSCPS